MKTRARHTLRLNVVLFLAMLAGACAPKGPTLATPPRPPPLARTKVLTGVTDLAQAEAKVTAALKAQGFGIITRIDIQATMKEKLGKDVRPYVILGACNPGFALQTLERDPLMGLLLPCKVIVYQRQDGAILVSLARPRSMFSLVSFSGLESVVSQVEARFERVFQSL